MGPLLDTLLQREEKSALTVEFEGRLRDQREIHILVRHGGSRRNKPGVAPHQFYQSHAVVDAARFRVRAVQHFDGFFNCGQVTKTPRDIDGRRLRQAPAIESRLDNGANAWPPLQIPTQAPCPLLHVRQSASSVDSENCSCLFIQSKTS